MTLEDLNYNDGYSSFEIQNYYLPLPLNFINQNNFDTRLRYSPQKTYGEYEDSFRKFNSIDRLDLATEYGMVNNIKAKFNRLIYWQEDAIGYIPINERALTTNEFGDPVQLGIGDIFDRFDEIVDALGNSNQFGVIESPVGFHWYDSKRKMFITLTQSMKLSQDSILKGLDSYFTNDIPFNMFEYDNPMNTFGVYGAYDAKHKAIYNTFRLPGETYDTIIINIKSNKFIGFVDFQARQYFSNKTELFSIGDSRSRIYRHNINYPGYYHVNYFPQYFTIIIKDDSNDPLVFDRFEFIGTEETFHKFICENSDQSVTMEKLYNRNLVFRNRRYYGTFPKTFLRERLTDGYLKLTFYYDATLNGGAYTDSREVTFNEIKTFFRKMI